MSFFYFLIWSQHCLKIRYTKPARAQIFKRHTRFLGSRGSESHTDGEQPVSGHGAVVGGQIQRQQSDNRGAALVRPVVERTVRDER